MRTRRLFYEDAYLTEFNAEVLSCRQEKDRYHIVLDQTAFYPEGGGQPADRGLLDHVTVIDVQYEGDEVVHITAEPLEIGRRVQGMIDWDYRFSLMQQHSGEHIVSGLIHKHYGYNNVGFHMGNECITIDMDGVLTQAQAEAIEAEANRYLWTNEKVRISFLTEEEKLTRKYRSKKALEGEVRLVEYNGADACACCGLHVASTGEIGLIKIKSVKKFRKGVRIEMLCAGQALKYLRVQEEQNRRIAAQLSVKPHETCQAVQHLQEEIYQLKGSLMALKEEKFRKNLSFIDKEKDVIIMEPGLLPADLRYCADLILKECHGICFVISGDDRTDYKYAAGRKGGDIRPLVKELNQKLNGRGGGKPEFVQGSFRCTKEEILTCFGALGFQII